MDQSVTELSGNWVRIRLTRGEWFFDPQRPLGRTGGFGQVFEGQDASGQPVAVKRLHLDVGEAAHRELKIADDLAARRYEHVLAVFDSGEDAEGGGYYVIMPRAEKSLADEISARGPLPTAETLEVLCQLALGLSEIEHIVHRDLKPENVLLHEGKWNRAIRGGCNFRQYS